MSHSKHQKKFENFESIDTNSLEDPLINNLIQSLNKNMPISIIKTCKANGENAQVSYNTQLQSWIIGSKNVCLAARNAEDLSLYSGLRFNFAKLISEIWFDIISKFSDVDRENLKEALKNKTINGEYIGNQDCQHIIEYKTRVLGC